MSKTLYKMVFNNSESRPQILWQFFLIFLPITVGVWLLLSKFEFFFHPYFEPVYFRIFFWESGFAFMMAPLGLAVLWLSRILSTRIKRPLGFACYGLGLGLCIFSVTALELRRPSTITWDIQMQPQDNLPVFVQKAKRQAQKAQKPILYYFYADWCPTCPDFERFVLGHPYLQAAIQNYFRCRLDLSDIKHWEQYLKKRFPQGNRNAVPAMVLESRSGKALHPAIHGVNTSLRLTLELLRSGLELP